MKSLLSIAALALVGASASAIPFPKNGVSSNLCGIYKGTEKICIAVGPGGRSYLEFRKTTPGIWAVAEKTMLPSGTVNYVSYTVYPGPAGIGIERVYELSVAAAADGVSRGTLKVDGVVQGTPFRMYGEVQLETPSR